MANAKISALTTILGTNVAAGDLFALVDVSDTTQAASGTTKKLTRDELAVALRTPFDARYLQLAGGAQTVAGTQTTTFSANVTSTNTASGTIVVTGGMGLSGDLFVGGGATIGATQSFTWSGRASLSSSATSVLTVGAVAMMRIGFGGTSNNVSEIAGVNGNGLQIRSAAGTATWNDSVTAASGTITNRNVFFLSAPTYTASNSSTTVTNPATFRIGGAPTASGVTFTNTARALWVESGLTTLGGNLEVQGTGITGLSGATGVGITLSTGSNPSRIVQGSSILDIVNDVTKSSGLRIVTASVIGTDDVFFQAFPGNAAGYGIFEGYNAAGTVISTDGNKPILFAPSRTEMMRLTSSGNLGIGLSPSYKLDVSGDVRISGDLRVGTYTSDGAILPDGYIRLRAYNGNQYDFAVRTV